MSVIGSNILAGASGSQGYQISRSVRLRSSASAYLNRTSGTPTSGSIFTHSFWVKRGVLGAQQTLISGQRPTNFDRIYFTATDTLVYQWNDGTSNLLYLETTQVFRDPSAWYHIVVATDTTQATSSNRANIYINNVQVTAFSTATYPTQNSTSYLNRNATTLNLGRATTAAFYFDGYLTEVNFIDGQALTPLAFGETNTTTGVWQPKKYAGTYGTNGFYLNFSNNSAATAAAIGKDYSGNGNNWTPNNISVTAGVTYDSMLDVPTQWVDGGNGRGNYCTLNRLDEYGTIGQMGCNSGNLISSPGGATTNKGFLTTLGINVGMTAYAEATFTTTSGDNNGGVAVTPQGNANPGDTATSMRWGDNGFIRTNNVGTAYGSALVTNDVVMMAVNYESATSCKVWIGKNGTWFASGNPATGANPGVTLNPAAVTMFIASYHFANLAVSNWTFGQRPFAYTPPSGFKALNTLNLPTPTILKGNQYFDATTYTGTNATLTITNSGAMQPDLVWAKVRSTTGQHVLTDSVRGVSTQLFSSLTNAETTEPGKGITAFNSNGFTLGTELAVTGSTNANGATYVGWQWKEGATQGFDIVTYTGNGANRTVAHNLGVAPSMMIFKPRNAVDNWPVWHKSFAVNEYVYLNLTNAKASLSTFMNSTLPNSSDITLGTWANTNANTQTMVAYLFAEVAGFSKFGSYTGNGSADGTFVFCGFRPRFVMLKRTDSTGAWTIVDSARNPFNVEDNQLYANHAFAEAGASNTIDALSNGFKLREIGSAFNASGGTYIFMAMAENPFKNALAR